MNTKSKLEKRLSGYWRLELANVALIPAFIVGFSFMSASPIGWLAIIAMIPMCGLLLVGGLYWRGKHRWLLGEKADLNAALALAHRLQYPLLALTILAFGLTVSAFGISGLAGTKGDLIAAVFSTALAALEYVNYYHRQVQHFDHMSDFKRLLAGRGFRRAQMAQDLVAWRQKRSV